MRTPFVFMWEDKNGNRHWDAIAEDCIKDFLRQLLEDNNVSPATVMCACNPILFHYVFEDYHNIADVHFNNIDEEIYGCEPHTKRKVTKLTPEKKKEIMKYGWLAPDGRFFNCDYGGHSNLADKIVGDIQYIANPERHLEELGWAKIMSGGRNVGKRYSIGMDWGGKLTDAQFKTLTRMGLDKETFGISELL